MIVGAVHTTGVNWEAVLITAVPSFFGMVAAIVAAVLSLHGKRGVEQINTAVNGVAPGEPSIRQNVETLTCRRDLDPRVNN
jgi:hypothetical protein